MKIYANPEVAIDNTKQRMVQLGSIVKSNYWQGIESPDATWELFNESFKIIDLTCDLVKTIKPNLPWADIHFEERVGGIPLNPPPSNEIWPFAMNGNKQFKINEAFSHTYPERFWPEYANAEETDGPNRGIRFPLGDLGALIDLIIKDPMTRQAYLPVWFPEDTGATMGQRVPCTLGYHFIIRGGYMHMNYYIRSCDVIRHFRDDIYLAIRLLHFIIGQLKERSTKRLVVLPGTYTMHITSLHCFLNEKGLLKLSKT